MDYAPYTIGVTAHYRAKMEREAARNWDRFYQRNKTNFFRDRHWTTSAATDGFPCIMECMNDDVILVEAGCGVANFAFPLLKAHPRLTVWMFDFAPAAVELVREAQQYDAERCKAFVWDFAADVAPPDEVRVVAHKAHFAALVFVLSAVPPDRQQNAVKALVGVLKPGGRVLFRDYAKGDLAQKRFGRESKIEENYFVRQDSTLSYFFDEDRVNELMVKAGLKKIYCRRVQRKIVNRKENLVMDRVFLQAEYMLPE